MLRPTLAAFAATAIITAPALADECAEPEQKPGRASAVTVASADLNAEGAEPAMKESGEKGGTADINIGVGELNETPEPEDAPKRLARNGDGETAAAGGKSSFAVEREMKESGEKGGTEDMNIGVGELQECTISKSTDKS